MFDNQELALIVDTLSKRYNWFIKQYNDPTNDDKQRQTFQQSANLLKSALDKLNDTASGSEINREASSISAADISVLIAEDDRYSAEMLRYVISDLGIKNNDIAVDGQQAVEIFRAASPPHQLVLCDWNMPKLNGMQVHQSIYKDADTANLHFMLVTAVEDTERIHAAIKQGVNDYIVKPIDIDILEKKIRARFKF